MFDARASESAGWHWRASLESDPADFLQRAGTQPAGL